MANATHKLNRKSFCEQMLRYGYFSEQLPPCFSSHSFADHTDALIKLANTKKDTSPVNMSIYKNETTRRVISVPNPCSFASTVNYMGQHWKQITHYAHSDNSHSPITCIDRYESFQPVHGLKEIEFINSENVRETRFIRSSFLENIKDRIKASLGFKYRLSVDIATCYNSIYTHSITWAICGKQRAKQYHATKGKTPKAIKHDYDFSNQLDVRIRSQKDAETSGILTGPFTSRIFSEILLARIDDIFRGNKTGFGNGYIFRRYVDDYKFYFRSEAEARNAVAEIERVLNEFHFSLNQSKIAIEQYPFDLISPLREKLDTAYQKDGVIGVLNEANHRYLAGDKGSYKYALKILRGKGLPVQDQDVALAMLFNINLINPKYAKYILAFFRKNKQMIGIGNLEKIIAHELNTCLDSHLEQETANFLFFIKELELKIPITLLTKALSLDNDFVSIIALDLWVNKRTQVVSTSPNDSTELNNAITQLEKRLQGISMDGEHWLLLYEAKRHCLLKQVDISQGKTASFFEEMDRLGISFYS